MYLFTLVSQSKSIQICMCIYCMICKWLQIEIHVYCMCTYVYVYWSVEDSEPTKIDLQKGKSGPYWNQLNIWKCLLKFREPESCRGSESSRKNWHFLTWTRKKRQSMLGWLPSRTRPQASLRKPTSPWCWHRITSSGDTHLTKDARQLAHLPSSWMIKRKNVSKHLVSC